MERPARSKPKAEPSPRGRALRLLARRDHTRLELERKLSPYVADGAELSTLLDDLAARGWISESRVVEQLLHVKRGRYGPARLRQLLLARGVAGEAVAAAIASVRGGEMEAARAVWSRKFREPPQTASERARQVRFLQARGFGIDVAMRIVGGEDGD